MPSFVYNLFETILGLIFRFGRSPLEVAVVYLKSMNESGDKTGEVPGYLCRMIVVNKGRDAVYTESISLRINEEQIFRRRDGSDRVRLDIKQPNRLELRFPVDDPDDIVVEGRFCVEVKPTSGKTIQIHGLFPVDIKD